MRVEASDDGASWDLVRRKARIFDFSDEPGRHADLLEVDYPVSTRRYLRATVSSDRGPPVVPSRAAVLLAERRPARTHHVWGERLDRTVHSERGVTVLEVDLGRSGVPHERVELSVRGDAEFLRPVTVEARDGEDDWRPLGQGAVHRVVDDGVVDERLEVAYPESRDRWIRLAIRDGDDAPLAVDRVVVRGLRRTIGLRAERGRTYRLLHGHPEARAPTYDLGAVLARRSRVDPTAATVGPARRNPAWRPPPPPAPPLTDRHPVLFWAVLAGAVAVLGVLTVRLLRRAASQS